MKRYGTIAVFREADGNRIEILVVKRGFDPDAGKWCLPTGHVRDYERPEQGARRELKEEAGLEIQDLIKIGKYVYPGVENSVYATRIENEMIGSGTDAFDSKWMYVEDKEYIQSLAMNHQKYVADAYIKLFDRKLEIVKESRMLFGIAICS